jgi:hypothetical protein
VKVKPTQRMTTTPICISVPITRVESILPSYARVLKNVADMIPVTAGELK